MSSEYSLHRLISFNHPIRPSLQKVKHRITLQNYRLPAIEKLEFPFDVDSFVSAFCVFTVVVRGTFFYTFAWSGDEFSVDARLTAVIWCDDFYDLSLRSQLWLQPGSDA